MTKFSVPEMSCGHCTSAIEKEIANNDPTAKFSFDLDDRTVEVTSALDTNALLAAIKEAGYEATAA